MIDWETIVEQHGPDVWRTTYRLLSDRDQASDCYQETFLQAVKYARRHTVENWASMLKRIATARALDCLLRRYRRGTTPFSDDGPVDSREQLPEQPVEMREWMDHLRPSRTLLGNEQTAGFLSGQVCFGRVLSRPGPRSCVGGDAGRMAYRSVPAGTKGKPLIG